MKILIVEDDQITANALTEALATHHYTVETTADGQMGLELAQSFHYDLLVVDIILPKLDGISLCRQLRSAVSSSASSSGAAPLFSSPKGCKQGLKTPILLLSAKDSSADRVRGLEAGADDYLIKPYELSELIARIQALLRRSSSYLGGVLTWEKLELNPDACQVSYGGKRLHLTPKEYGILELFLRNPQRIFSRSAILDRVWSTDDFPQEVAVSTQIKGLRQKLKAAGMTTDLIETVYSLGYRLRPEPKDFASQSVPQEEMERVGTQSALPSSTSSSTAVPLFSSFKGCTRSHAVPIVQADKRQAQVLAVVQQMWGSFKESLGSKMVLFEQVIAQLSIGTLDSELRQQAKAEAHYLIGSLGTFGLPEGSEVARQIERLLQAESLSQNQARQIEEWVSQLKQAVENKPSTTTATATADLKRVPSRLLVVDDDIVLSEQVKQEAIAWGLQVDVATNLTAARKAISHHPPDVILLDLTFPETTENGLTLLAELTQVTPTIPVLVLSERNQLSDRVEVVRLGGHAFLGKPITPEHILAAVTQALNRTQEAEAKVLIVDDNSQVLTALSTLLKPWGLHVTTLADPQQFWQVLEASAPDLLILDIEMPGFSGIELCQVVRQDSRWSELPVLFLSAHNEAEIVYQAFAIGADDYVHKPIVGPELIARILNRLERNRVLHKFAETNELTGMARLSNYSRNSNASK